MNREAAEKYRDVQAAFLAAWKIRNEREAMRDAERIDRMVDLLKAAWKLSPDLRLTQLVVAAARLGGEESHDCYYTEDDISERGLSVMLAERRHD